MVMDLVMVVNVMVVVYDSSLVITVARHVYVVAWSLWLMSDFAVVVVSAVAVVVVAAVVAWSLWLLLRHYYVDGGCTCSFGRSSSSRRGSWARLTSASHEASNRP